MRNRGPNIIRNSIDAPIQFEPVDLHGPVILSLEIDLLIVIRLQSYQRILETQGSLVNGRNEFTFPDFNRYFIPGFRGKILWEEGIFLSVISTPPFSRKIKEFM